MTALLSGSRAGDPERGSAAAGLVRDVEQATPPHPPAERPAGPRLCFVALNAYGLLSEGARVAHLGGAERQQVVLARELARLGYSISFVTLDHGQPDGEVVDSGIRVFKAYRPESGIRGIRFVHPRLTSLWAAMSRANADVYYQRGADAETGLVAAWCRRRRRPFVFAGAGDANFFPGVEMLGSFHERVLYRYGLRHADRIVAQTEQQRKLLLEGFGLHSAVVRSCWSAPIETIVRRPANPAMALWVGRLSAEKRPEWVVALARKLPQYRFEVAGQANFSSPFASRIGEQLRSLPNVTWHGLLRHDRLQEVYARATVLVCTSESEGFPNVFLEAWGHGVPTVSTVDPDGLIGEHRLGGVGASYEELQKEVERALADPDVCREQGRRAAAYVRANHAPAASAAALDGVLRTLLPRSPTGAPRPL
jgi:glycosyltransferase involved in cell wall biosynthesis